MREPTVHPRDRDGAAADVRHNEENDSLTRHQENGSSIALTGHSLSAPDNIAPLGASATTAGLLSDTYTPQRRLSSVSLRASLRSVQSQEDQQLPLAASTHSVASLPRSAEDIATLADDSDAPVGDGRRGSTAESGETVSEVTSKVGQGVLAARSDALAEGDRASELPCDEAVEEKHEGGGKHQRGSFPQAFPPLPQMPTLKSSVYSTHPSSALHATALAGDNVTHAKTAVPSRIASAIGRGANGGLSLGAAPKDGLLGNHAHSSISFTARKTSVTFDMSALPTYELTNTSSSAHTLPQLATGLSSVSGSVVTTTAAAAGVGRGCNAPLDVHTTQDSSKSNLTNSSLPSSYAATLTSASVVEGHKSSPTFGTHLVRIVGHGGGGGGGVVTMDSVNTATESTYSVAELTTTITDPSQSARTSSFTMPGSGSTAAALSSLALRTPPHSSNDSNNTTTTTGPDSVISTAPPQSLLDGGPQSSTSLSSMCRSRSGMSHAAGAGSPTVAGTGDKTDARPSPPIATTVAPTGAGRTGAKAPAPSATRLTRDLLPGNASLTLGLFPTSLSRSQSESGQATTATTTTTESSMSQRSMTAEPHSATATTLNSTSSNGSRGAGLEERAHTHRSTATASTSATPSATTKTAARRSRIVAAASSIELSRARPSPSTVTRSSETHHTTDADAARGGAEGMQSRTAPAAARRISDVARRGGGNSSSSHGREPDRTPPPAGAAAGGQTAGARRLDGPQTMSVDVASPMRQLTVPPSLHGSFFSHQSSGATSKRNSATDSPPALSQTTNSAVMHNATTAAATRRLSATDDNAGHPVALRPAAMLAEHELHSEHGAEVQDRLSSGSTTRLQARLMRAAVGSMNNSATDVVLLSCDNGSHGSHIPADLTHHPFVSSMTSPQVAHSSLRESDPALGVAAATVPRCDDAATTQHVSGATTAVAAQQQRSLAESGRRGNHGHTEGGGTAASTTTQHHVSPGSGIAAHVGKSTSVHLTKPLHDSASFMIASLSSSSNAATSMSAHVNHDDHATTTVTTPPTGSPSEANTVSPSATTLLCERSSASTVVVLSPFHVEGAETLAHATSPSASPVATMSTPAQRTSPVKRFLGRFQSLLHGHSLTTPPVLDTADEGATTRTTRTSVEVPSPQLCKSHCEDSVTADQDRGVAPKDEPAEAGEQLPRGAVALLPARRSYRAFRSASHNSTPHLTPQWSSVVEGAASVTTSAAVGGQTYTTLSSPYTAVLSVPPTALYGGSASQRRSSLTPQKSGAAGGRCSLFVVPPSQPTPTTPKTASLTITTTLTEAVHDEATAPQQASPPPRHQSSQPQQQLQLPPQQQQQNGVAAAPGQQSPPPPSFLFHVANSLSRASSGSNYNCPTSQDNSTSTRSSGAMLATLSEGMQSSLASPTACVSEPLPSAQEFEQLCQSPLYAGQGGVLSLWLDALQRGTNLSRTPTAQTSIAAPLDRPTVVVTMTVAATTAAPAAAATSMDDREARVSHDRPLASCPGTPATPASSSTVTVASQTPHRGKAPRKRHYTSYISFFSMRDRPASPPPPPPPPPQPTSGAASPEKAAADLAARHDISDAITETGGPSVAEAGYTADASEAQLRAAEEAARLVVKSGKAIGLAAPRGFHSVLDETDVSTTSFSAAGLNSVSSGARESHQTTTTTATTHTASSHSQSSVAAPLRRQLRAESDVSSTALSSMLERSSMSGRLAPTSHHGSESVSRSLGGVDARSHSSSWYSMHRGASGQSTGGGGGKDGHAAGSSVSSSPVAASPQQAGAAAARGLGSPVTTTLAPTTPNAGDQVRRNAPVVSLCEPFTALPHHAALAAAVVSPGSSRRSRFSLLSESMDRRISSGSSCNASRAASSFSDSSHDMVSADVQAEAATTSTAVYSASDDGADLAPGEVTFTYGKDKDVVANQRQPSASAGGRSSATSPSAAQGRPPSALGTVPPPPPSSSSAPVSSDVVTTEECDEGRGGEMAGMTLATTAAAAVTQPSAVVVVDDEASCPRAIAERKGEAAASWRQKGEAASILYRSSLSRSSRSSRSAHSRTPVNTNSSITSTHSNTEGATAGGVGGEGTAAVVESQKATPPCDKPLDAPTDIHSSQPGAAASAPALVSDAARPRRSARRRLTTAVMATHYRHGTSAPVGATVSEEAAGAKPHVTVLPAAQEPTPAATTSSEATLAVPRESGSPSMPVSLSATTLDAAAAAATARQSAAVAPERASLPSSALSSEELRETDDSRIVTVACIGETRAGESQAASATGVAPAQGTTPTMVATSPEARTSGGPRPHTQSTSVDVGDSTSAPLLPARPNAMLFPSFAHQASAYGSFAQGSQYLFGEMVPSPGISVGYETVTNSFEHDIPLNSMQSLKANDEEAVVRQSMNTGGFAHFGAAARTPTGLQAPAPPPATRMSRQASVGSHSPSDLANSCEHSTSLIPSLLYVRRDLMKGQEWSQLSSRLANIAATAPSPSGHVDGEAAARGKDARGTEQRVRATTKSKSRQSGGATRGQPSSATRPSRGAEAKTTRTQPAIAPDIVKAQPGAAEQAPTTTAPGAAQPPTWPASPTMRTPHPLPMASLTSTSSSLTSVAATATPFDGGEAANYAPVPVRRNVTGLPKSTFGRRASESDRGALRTPTTAATSMSEGHGISWDDSTTSQSFTTPTVRPASHTQTMAAPTDGKPAPGVVIVPSHETGASAMPPSSPGDVVAGGGGKEGQSGPLREPCGAAPPTQKTHVSATPAAVAAAATWSALRASQPAPQLHGGVTAKLGGAGGVSSSADAAQTVSRRPSTSATTTGPRRLSMEVHDGHRDMRVPPRAPPPPPPPVQLASAAGAIAVPAPPSTQLAKPGAKDNGSKPGRLTSNTSDLAGRTAGVTVGGAGARKGSAGSHRGGDATECVNSHGLNLTPVVSAPLWPSYASITYERRMRQDGSRVNKTQALHATRQTCSGGDEEAKGPQGGAGQQRESDGDGGTPEAQLPQCDVAADRPGQGTHGGGVAGLNRVGSTLSLGSRREFWGPFPATVTDELDTSFTFSVLSGVTEATEAVMSPPGEQRSQRREDKPSERSSGGGRSKSRQSRAQAGSVPAKRRGGPTTSSPRLQRTDSVSSIVSCSSSRAAMKLYTFKEKNTAGSNFAPSGRKTKPQDISRAPSMRSRSGSMRRRNKQSPRVMPPPPPPPPCTFPQGRTHGAGNSEGGPRATSHEGGDATRGKVLVAQPTVELLRMHTRDSASQNSLGTRHRRSGDEAGGGPVPAVEDAASSSSSDSHGDSASSVVSSILACSLTTGLRNFSSNTAHDDWHFFSSATGHGVSSTSSTATRNNTTTAFTPHFGNSTGNSSGNSNGLTRDGTMSSFRAGLNRAGASTRGAVQPHHHGSNAASTFATARVPGAPTVGATPKKAKTQSAQANTGSAEPSTPAQCMHSDTPQVGTLPRPSLEVSPVASPLDETVARSEGRVTAESATDTGAPSGQKTASNNGQGGRTWTIPYPPQVPRPPATRTGGGNATVSGRREAKQAVRRR